MTDNARRIQALALVLVIFVVASLVLGGGVGLIIDKLAIPDSLIYQRNETYQREQQPYCHVWTVKLSNWRPNTTVTLANRNSVPDLSAQQNTFTIQVK